MKKIIYFLIFISFFQCEKNRHDNEYSIDGSINRETGKAYLLNFEESKIIDSTIIINGKFNLTGKISCPDYFYLKIKNSPYKNGFFIERGNFNIKIREDKRSYSFNFKGGELTKLWRIYQKIFSKRQKIFNDLREKINSSQDNDFYIRKYDSINKMIQLEVDHYIQNNKNSITSSLAILFNKRDLPSLKKYYNILSKNVKKSTGGKRILKKITELESKKKVGDIFANYDFVDLKLKKVKLSDYISINQLTLIDFWASWCGPCRKQHPFLIKLFNKYKKQNFNIVSISIDRKISAWENAIRKDQLPWNQLIDSNKISIKDLKIKSIPSSFLIDSKRKIIAIDMNLNNLQKTLDSINTHK